MMLQPLYLRKKVGVKTRNTKYHLLSKLSLYLFLKKDQQNMVLVRVSNRTSQGPKIRRKLNNITIESEGT